MKYTSANSYGWGREFGSYNCGVEVSIQALDNFINLFGNVMIIEDRLNEIMMHFTKGVFKVKKGDDNRALLYPRLVDDVCHLSCVFQSARQIGSEAFLNLLFNEIISR